MLILQHLLSCHCWLYPLSRFHWISSTLEHLVRVYPATQLPEHMLDHVSAQNGDMETLRLNKCNLFSVHLAAPASCHMKVSSYNCNLNMKCLLLLLLLLPLPLSFLAVGASSRRLDLDHRPSGDSDCSLSLSLSSLCGCCAACLLFVGLFVTQVSLPVHQQPPSESTPVFMHLYLYLSSCGVACFCD